MYMKTTSLSLRVTLLALSLAFFSINVQAASITTFFPTAITRLTMISSPGIWSDFWSFFRPGVKPSKEEKTENTAIRSAQAIDISLPCDIEILQKKGARPMCIAKGAENYVDLLEYTEKNGILSIRLQDNKKISNPGRLFLTIQVDQLQEVKLRGVGDTKIKGRMQQEKLAIYSSGVGDIRLEHIEVQQLTLKQKGVGDLYAKGKCRYAILTNSGVGDFRTKELICDTAEIKNSGVGDMNCHVTDLVSVQNSGVGDLSLTSTARIKELSNNGVGNLTINKK